MPLIDMPLEELHQYKGSSPYPADFDAFWARSMDELHATPAQISLVPSSFQVPFAECFDLTFTGVGGARIYAKYLRPKTGGAHPAVVQFHGYTGSSGGWTEKLSYVAAGYCVAALDCRGQGGRSEDVGGVHGNTMNGQIIRGLVDGPEKLLFRSIYLDCARLVELVMSFDEVDADRVGVMGGSQGGALTLVAASLCPTVKRAAPLYPFLSDFKRVWDMDLCHNAYEEFDQYFRRFDPRHEREDYFFNTLSYIDIQYLVPRIRGEVKLFVGLMDTTCPPSTQFAAYNRMTCKKDLVIYPDFGHEGLPGADDISYQFMLGL